MRESVTIKQVVAILAHILEIGPVERDGWIVDVCGCEMDAMMDNVALRSVADFAAPAVDVEALVDEAGTAALPRFGVVEVFSPRLHAITFRVKGSGTLWSSSAPHREIKEYKEIGGIIMNPT